MSARSVPAHALIYSASSQDGDLAPIRRAFVVGDTLYTVSEAGLETGSLTDLAERAFVTFPRDEDHPQPQPATDPV